VLQLSRILHLLGSRGIPTFLFGLMAAVAFRKVLQDETFAAQLFHLLSGALWAMFTVLVNIRPIPLRRGSPIGAAAAVGAQLSFIGTGLPSDTSHAGIWLILGDVLLFGGLAFALVSVVVLGRCFGVLPDVRGLVTRGPYRFVRHPLYLGELTASLGMVVGSSGRLLPAVALLLSIVFQLVRAHFEEQTLRAEFPEYEAYAARTKRLIPGIV
jgi:protein-S-isoprenylcysteine O-methyltransferase Ste14